MLNFDAIGYIAPVLILLITALALAARRANKNTPVLILLFLWVVVFSAHGLAVTFQVIPLFPSGIEPNSKILLALLTITFSYVLWRNMLYWAAGTRYGGFELNVYSDRGRFIPRWIQWIIAAFALLVLIMMVHKAVSILGTTDVLGSMQLLRTRLNYEDASWGAVAYLGFIVTVLAVYMFTLTQGQAIVARLPALLTVLFAFGIALVTTQRTSILLLLVAMCFAQSRKGLPSLRMIGLLGSAFVSFFIGIGFLVGKVGQEGSTIGEVFFFGWNSFLLYFLTPLSAFSYSEVWVNPAADGGFTLRFFLRIMEAVNLYSGDIPNLVQEFVWVPVPTNVYTFAHMAISDFGSLFLIYYFIIGGILGIVFAFPRRGPVMRTLQGFTYYPIVMTVFQDQFFMITSQWIQILLVLYFCHAITRRSKHTYISSNQHPTQDLRSLSGDIT